VAASDRLEGVVEAFRAAERDLEVARTRLDAALRAAIRSGMSIERVAEEAGFSTRHVRRVRDS
jgi:hypothetical protein